MPVVTPRRLASAAAVPAFVLALAACSSDSGAESGEDDAAAQNPAQAVLASYTGLESESYTMETTMTLNGVEFVSSTNLVDGESTRASQDLYLSVLLEATGEDFSEDPEAAELMESMFTDMHTETVLVDGVLYMQISGGMLDTSGEFGEDAWFTTDLTEQAELSEIYEQVGGFDLAAQTETLLNEVAEVEQTGDGVYTGTLSGDSEVMQSMLGATAAAADPAAQTLVEDAEITVTVDDQGLLQTMEIAFPEIEGMTMHLVSEVVEIGGDYDIAAPDSDNLHSFDELGGLTP